MNCPECDHGYSYVVDSRPRIDSVWRRRQCQKCKATWTTVESINLSDKQIEALMEDLEVAAVQISGVRNILKAMKTRRGPK